MSTIISETRRQIDELRVLLILHEIQHQAALMPWTKRRHAKQVSRLEAAIRELEKKL